MKNNWPQLKLGEILSESKIKSHDPNTQKRVRVKLNIGGIEKRPDTNDTEGATQYYVRKAGQFIYGKQNLHKGAFGIVPNELDGFESSSDIPAFDVHESCYPEWVFYFFKQNNFYLKLESLAKGVGSKRIQPKQLYELIILLPPKEEQRKILDSLIDFEKKKEKILQEIEQQNILIDKLRSNSINDAIQGKLTEDWRIENPNVRSAMEILDVLRIKKRELVSKKKILVEKVLSALKASEYPYQLPNSWIWCRLDDIMSITGGVTKGKIYNDELISTPYLRVANVQRNHLDLTVIKDIVVSRKEYIKYQLEIGDLLMAEGGDADKVGRCAIWNNEIPGCIHQNHIFRLRIFDKSLVAGKYVIEYLNSPLNQKYYESSSKQTTNLASINKTIARSTPIALPPFQEQEEICRKLVSINSHINELQQSINQKKEGLEQLNHSILKNAFGEFNSDILNNSIGEIISNIKSNNTSSFAFVKNKLTMEIEELLNVHGKMSAIDLWKMSKFNKDIDAFYEEVKRLVEVVKIVKESKEKGFLELVK